MSVYMPNSLSDSHMHQQFYYKTLHVIDHYEQTHTSLKFYTYSWIIFIKLFL